MSTTTDDELDAAFVSVHDEPRRSIAVATAVLRRRNTAARVRARARWLRGLARREIGELAAGTADLQSAEQAAAEAGDEQLAASIGITLALHVMYSGSADDALALLERAEPHLRGTERTRLRAQRALVLHRCGRLNEAEVVYEEVLRRARRERDALNRVRALSNLAILRAQQGDIERSERLADEAFVAAESAGQRLMAASALHNRGYARGRAGRIAAALADLADVEERFRALDRFDRVFSAQVDHAEVLLAANLLDDAAELSTRALAGVRLHGTPTDVADACLLAARCLHAAHRREARRHAAEAARLFRRQEREALAAYADHLVALTRAGRLDVETVAALTAELDRHGWNNEAIEAKAHAAHQAIVAGELDQARRWLDELGAVRRLPPRGQIAHRLAEAHYAVTAGQTGAAWRAVSRGLQVVTTNHLSLSALELSAHNERQADALIALAAELPAPGGARRLLRLLTTSRRTSVAVGAGTAPTPALAELLTELRLASSEQHQAVAAGAGASDTAPLTRRIAELERRIRQLSGSRTATGTQRRFDLDAAIEQLGDRVFVQYVVGRNVVVAVVVNDGRVSRHALVAHQQLVACVDAIGHALHRLHRTNASARSRAAAGQTLRQQAEMLQQHLLPPPLLRAVAAGSGVVLVPDGVLHGMPWALLPALRGAPVSAVPSLAAWNALAGAPAPRRRRALLVAGPDLAAAEDEIRRVAAIYERPTVLVGATATVENVRAALATHHLAHIACHGHFRSDSPMFSTLQLADGFLTVHDFEQLRRLPETMVLPACNAAANTATRGGAVLGVASALMAFGVRSVVAPLTPINDDAAAALMTALHRRLAAGAQPAAALAATVAEADDSASAFIDLGR